MNAMMVVSPQELTVAPSPRSRVCPFCIEGEAALARLEGRRIRYQLATFDLTDDWCCTGCGRKVVVHHQNEPCESCGKIAPTRYYANRRKQFCDCHLSREEQEAQEKARQEFEEAEQRRQQRAVEAELERQRREREQEAKQRKADRCWEDKGRHCSVKAKAQPFSFCAECVRFKPRDHRPPPSHLEPEFEEQEFEPDPY